MVHEHIFIHFESLISLQRETVYDETKGYILDELLS